MKEKEWYDDIREYRQEKRAKKESRIIVSAIKKIESLGYKCIDRGDNITFKYKGSNIVYWPYSGWASGKTIKDGRGLNKLVKQLEANK